MKRIAIFVEGYTELLFVSRLIEEIAGTKNVVIAKMQIRGGSRAPKSIRQIEAIKTTTDESFYFLIFDCGGEEAVASRVREEHQNLTDKGYQKILGIRDVRPKFTRDEIPKLELMLRLYIKTSLIPVEFYLAVMEIESWFLAEHSHLQRIDPSLTTALIQNKLNFDPSIEDMSLRARPAEDLSACYQLVGKQYEKGTSATISSLDYTLLYVDLQEHIPYLKKLNSTINEFLS